MCFYFQPLRRALTKMGASAQLLQSLIPDSQDNSLSFSVLNYLKRLKNQAKVEFEKLCADVINKSSSNNTQKVIKVFLIILVPICIPVPILYCTREWTISNQLVVNSCLQLSEQFLISCWWYKCYYYYYYSNEKKKWKKQSTMIDGNKLASYNIAGEIYCKDTPLPYLLGIKQ